MTQIARIEPDNQIIHSGRVDIASAIEQISSKAITHDSVEALDRLLIIAERENARVAKQQFTAAFARVRERCQKINASRAVPDKQGNARWWVADLIDLQDEIEPICRSEGLELSFDTRREGPNATIVIGVCMVMHIATGHMEKRECGMSVANAQGGDLGAATSAKRGALIAMFALRIRHDENARMLGDLVSAEQAGELRKRLNAVGGDERKFLEYAGSPDWKQIRQGRLGQLHEYLRGKERKAVTPDAPVDPPTRFDEPDKDFEKATAHTTPLPPAEKPNKVPPLEMVKSNKNAAWKAFGELHPEKNIELWRGLMRRFIPDKKEPQWSADDWMNFEAFIKAIAPVADAK